MENPCINPARAAWSPGRLLRHPRSIDGELRALSWVRHRSRFRAERSAALVYIRPTPTQSGKFKFQYVLRDLEIRESTNALRQAPARRLDRARRGGADLTRARARADGARRPQRQAEIEQPCRWQSALQKCARRRPTRDRRRPRRPGDRSGWRDRTQRAPTAERSNTAGADGREIEHSRR